MQRQGAILWQLLRTHLRQLVSVAPMGSKVFEPTPQKGRLCFQATGDYDKSTIIPSLKSSNISDFTLACSDQHYQDRIDSESGIDLRFGAAIVDELVHTMTSAVMQWSAWNGLSFKNSSRNSQCFDRFNMERNIGLKLSLSAQLFLLRLAGTGSP